jgi:ABC-2 type transport system ATP-binding protein
MTSRSLQIADPPAPEAGAVDLAVADQRPDPGGAPLTLRGLSKRWRKDLPLVLDGLDLTLAPGTTTWVGGRNGVGKTTMLRVAAGLIEPDSGRAEVWGFSSLENRARYQQLV